jgi:hypothetical protein
MRTKWRPADMASPVSAGSASIQPARVVAAQLDAADNGIEATSESKRVERPPRLRWR